VFFPWTVRSRHGQTRRSGAQARPAQCQRGAQDLNSEVGAERDRGGRSSPQSSSAAGGVYGFASSLAAERSRERVRENEGVEALL
jgi:hypothetical protein